MDLKINKIYRKSPIKIPDLDFPRLKHLKLEELEFQHKVDPNLPKIDKFKSAFEKEVDEFLKAKINESSKNKEAEEIIEEVLPEKKDEVQTVFVEPDLNEDDYYSSEGEVLYSDDDLQRNTEIPKSTKKEKAVSDNEELNDVLEETANQDLPAENDDLDEDLKTEEENKKTYINKDNNYYIDKFERYLKLNHTKDLTHKFTEFSDKEDIRKAMKKEKKQYKFGMNFKKFKIITILFFFFVEFIARKLFKLKIFAGFAVSQLMTIEQYNEYFYELAEKVDFSSSDLPLHWRMSISIGIQFIVFLGLGLLSKVKFINLEDFNYISLYNKLNQNNEVKKGFGIDMLSNIFDGFCGDKQSMFDLFKVFMGNNTKTPTVQKETVMKGPSFKNL